MNTRRPRQRRSVERRQRKGRNWRFLTGLAGVGALGYLVFGGRRRTPGSNATPLAAEPEGRPVFVGREGWMAGPGGEIFVRDIGDFGPKVLLLHGLAGSCDQWTEVLMGLGTDFQLAAPDLRGHARSRGAGRSYRATDLALDLQAVLLGLGWSRCHVVAADLGAVAAFELALRSAQIERLLVVDPVAALDPAELEGLLTAVENDPRRELRMQFQLLLAGSSQDVQTQVLQDLESLDEGDLAALFRLLMTYDPEPGVKTLTGRLLTVLSPLRAASSRPRALPGPAIKLPDGASHWPMLDSPMELNHLIRRWVLDS